MRRKRRCTVLEPERRRRGVTSRRRRISASGGGTATRSSGGAAVGSGECGGGVGLARGRREAAARARLRARRRQWRLGLERVVRGGNGTGGDEDLGFRKGGPLRPVLTRPARPLRARHTSCTPASHTARVGSRRGRDADRRAHLSVSAEKGKEKCVFPTSVNRCFDPFNA